MTRGTPYTWTLTRFDSVLRQALLFIALGVTLPLVHCDLVYLLDQFFSIFSIVGIEVQSYLCLLPATDGSDSQQRLLEDINALHEIENYDKV